MKLSYKFFLAFVLTSLTIVALMIVTMRLYGYMKFSEYVHKMEVMRLSELVALLGEEYDKNQGWEPLRNNYQRWRYLLRPRQFISYPNKLSQMPPDLSTYMSPPPPPPQDKHRENRFPPGTPPPEAPFSMGGGKKRPPRPLDERDLEGLNRSKGRPGKRPRPPLGIEHRLTLFDAEKHPIVGAANSTEGHTLREITVDSNTVGWLGLKKENRLTHPLDIAFLKEQSQAFYVTGCFILVLAAVVAFLLARHLLAPVKQLTDGTQAMTSRNFATRIKVHTTDELGQLAADFNRMAQTLEGFERIRRQWISDIAHELRTPLSILRGEVEALQDGVRDVNRETLNSLHSEVVHLSQIVQDLHDLSLAESGALHFKKERVDPVEVLRKILIKFKHRFVENHIIITDRIGDGAPMTVLGDEDRLTQLFSNLLENTLRYTDKPGMLKVWHSFTDTDVLLYFEDTAPGVPENSMERLFDKLYRVDPSRSRAQGGSGLGLAICKSIVEAHGGEIKAAKAPSGGLHIQITLPRIG
jgi:two-component system sensor histidine kinase BaeS